MRVRQTCSDTQTRSRRPVQSVYMEATCLGDRGNGRSRDPQMMSDGTNSKVPDNGSYSLVRRNSAVFEHDLSSNRTSLVRTVSELREEMQSGVNQSTKIHHKKDGYSSDRKPGSGTPDRKLVRQVSHEISHESYSPVGKKGQIDSFVLKNYSLQDRRTLSLPIGKEYTINQYVGHACEVEAHMEATNASKSASYTHSHTSISETSSCHGDFESCNHDFDVEAERHSKSTLLFQAVTTLLTILTAIFTVYLYIRFLTSVPSYHHVSDNDMHPNGSRELHESHLGVLWCMFFTKACPLLGVLKVGLAVAMGAWVSDGCSWHRLRRTTACVHCEDYESNRSRAEEADEKVQRAQRSKQQFMAYVFHNIRVPFNAIVLGLGHMRATGGGVSSLGTVADKMDLVQMMLDCAETMTSVLDDVTDMGQWEVGQMELHKDEFDILAVINFLSWGLKDLLEQKQITFNMNVDDLANQLLTSHRVIGDKQRVVQTLGNFLSNAVKFTPSGGTLDLNLQCEEVTENKVTDIPTVNSAPAAPTTFSEGSFLGTNGTQILTKSVSQIKTGETKIARLRISVKDNGIGISASDQAKLFEPYSFVTSGWVQKAGVSGLGLSMAKRFVERCGGSIGVDSVEGTGSTFFFSIPFPIVEIDVGSDREALKIDSGAAALLEKSEVTQSTSSSGVTVVHESITLSRRRSSMGKGEDLRTPPKGRAAKVADVKGEDLKTVPKGRAAKVADVKGEDLKTVPEGRAAKTPDVAHEDPAVFQRKVLLVEDTRINRIILRKILQNLNLECDEAENGQIAVDLYKEGRTYDLVLMDKEMPVMDGHEATRQLRTMGVKTPIVALTGNALATDRELFFEAGVDDFQTKPLSRDKLVQLLARYGVESSSAKRG